MKSNQSFNVTKYNQYKFAVALAETQRCEEEKYVEIDHSALQNKNLQSSIFRVFLIEKISFHG